MVTCFLDEKNKSKKKCEKYEKLTTKLKSFNTFVIIATTSSFITLSHTGIGLKAIPISTATACGLSIGNKITFAIIITKYDKQKKQYQRDQQTIKCSDKLYRKSLQDNLIDKSEYE